MTDAGILIPAGDAADIPGKSSGKVDLRADSVLRCNGQGSSRHVGVTESTHG